jgi:hypothetical protein
MRVVLRFFAAVAFGMSVTAAHASFGGDNNSDLWWVPSESGWGVQFVQQGSLIYATMFVYDANAKPTWYVALMQFQSSPPVTFTGQLYQTTGPWFGGSFDPNAVAASVVGTMTFVENFVEKGTLTYNVGNVTVSKAITRQTLQNWDFSDTYAGLVNRSNGGCVVPGVPAATSTPVGITIVHTGATFSMTTNDATSDICRYTGTYQQLGRMGFVTGTFACTDGEIGNFTTFAMELNDSGFTARLQATSNRCTVIKGRLGGLVTTP